MNSFCFAGHEWSEPSTKEQPLAPDFSEHIMPHYVDLNDVRTFVLAAQAGTMSAAAKTLHQPASTVSRSLTRLEKHLGVLLAQRGPKGLILTDAGKEYLLACRRALRTLTDGEEFLEARRSDPSGTIKIACPLTMAREILAPLLKDFVARFPSLRMEIEPYSFGWDQEPREDVDVFFKLKAPKDSVRRVRSPRSSGQMGEAKLHGHTFLISHLVFYKRFRLFLNCRPGESVVQKLTDELKSLVGSCEASRAPKESMNHPFPHIEANIDS